MEGEEGGLDSGRVGEWGVKMTGTVSPAVGCSGLHWDKSNKPVAITKSIIPILPSFKYFGSDSAVFHVCTIAGEEPALNLEGQSLKEMVG